jgi:hypothetical protein
VVPNVALLDEVLGGYADAIGRDFTGYRNHAQRVATFCIALSGADGESREKIALAAALHDVGIWTAGTFDYLEPSVMVATAHLTRVGRSAWTPEVAAMIRHHHRITRSDERSDWLVEPFRRADWTDVSLGALTWGLPRSFVREVMGEWPNAGFHVTLARLTVGRCASHPLSPLPMVRL